MSIEKVAILNQKFPDIPPCIENSFPAPDTDNLLGEITVIVTNHNNESALGICLASILDIPEINDIVIADNGSVDGSVEFIASLECAYVSFDEGRQNMGKVWNTILDNFPLKEYCLFLDSNIKVTRRSVLEMLYAASFDDCGIVGPLSNDFLPPQQVCEEMMTVKEPFNDVVGIQNGAFMVKTKILSQCGAFDENYFDSDNVLVDYCFRLLDFGKKNRICERSFVEYVYSKDNFIDSDLSLKDREYMKSKYGMNYFNISSNMALCNLISSPKESTIRVLEIGCDLGATLLEVKRLFPNAQIKGVEINHNSVSIAEKLADIKWGNIEELTIPFEGKFDYIIFGDVLEHLRNTEDVLNYCKEILSPNGYIVASVPNLMHISVMENLIKGRFTYTDMGLLDRTHIHFFTYFELMEMLERTGFIAEDTKSSSFGLHPEQEKMIDKLLDMSSDTQRFMYTSFQYIFRAKIKEQ